MLAVQVDFGGVPAEERGRRGCRCVVGRLVVVVTVAAVAQLLGGVTPVDGGGDCSCCCRSRSGVRRRRGHEGTRVQGAGRRILGRCRIDGDGLRRWRTRTDRLRTYYGRLRELVLLLRRQRRRYKGGTKDRTRSEIRGDVNFKMRYER